MKVSPSILAMDFSKKEEEILKIDQTDCEYIHLDVMDGIFVPNTTFDYNLIKDLNSKKIYRKSHFYYRENTSEWKCAYWSCQDFFLTIFKHLKSFKVNGKNDQIWFICE